MNPNAPTQNKANAVGFSSALAVILIWLLGHYQPDLMESAPAGLEAAFVGVIAYVMARLRKENRA